MCVNGRWKVTTLWPVLEALTAMAPPLVLRRLEHVRCAIGCKDVGGAGVSITLGDGTPTGGAGVVAVTLGGRAATGSNGAGV